MTEKQKEFLLADISARLPYGVKCAEIYPDGNKFENVWDIIRVSKYVEDGIHISNCKTIYGYCSQIQNIKPYLFPLSSMTEEQEKELEEIDPEFYSVIRENGNICISMDVRGYDWLNKNNFDYRGLIPKGLAIDATNLNIY